MERFDHVFAKCIFFPSWLIQVVKIKCFIFIKCCRINVINLVHLFNNLNCIFPKNLTIINCCIYFIGQRVDGMHYKTAYRCEGEEMTISCDVNEVIQVIRANYGRFSIAICNKHGYTDWSVNCMSPETKRVLQSE